MAEELGWDEAGIEAEIEEAESQIRSMGSVSAVVLYQLIL